MFNKEENNNSLLFFFFQSCGIAYACSNFYKIHPWPDLCRVEGGGHFCPKGCAGRGAPLWCEAEFGGGVPCRAGSCAEPCAAAAAVATEWTKGARVEAELHRDDPAHGGEACLLPGGGGFLTGFFHFRTTLLRSKKIGRAQA